MTVLYVISERPRSGKTALCAALARSLADKGVSVEVLKAVAAAGIGAESDADPAIFESLLGQQGNGLPLATPDAGLTEDALAEIKGAVDRASHEANAVIVEGSSGLSESDASRLVEALDARVIVVASHYPGLSSNELMPWRERLGERLLGFVVNGLTRYQGSDAANVLLPSLDSEGLVSFGIVPEDRRLLGVSVGEIAAHLGGRFIVLEEQTDELVEHFLVGCLTMDPGELYFGLRQNKGVIVRGDRPDIQMACLATPTACLVLTKGVEPIEYVSYEAQEENIPIIVVQSDTLATMDAVNSLLDRARFDHPAKLARYGELLDEHVDLEALYSAMGLSL